MWSVPFNLGVHSSYLAVGMVYNEGRFAIVFLVNIIIVIVIKPKGLRAESARAFTVQ